MKKIVLIVIGYLFFNVAILFPQSNLLKPFSTDILGKDVDNEDISNKKTFNDSIEMVAIPTGTFKMGQISVAEPVHKVNIKRAFLIGKYEVTQKQYEKVMRFNPSRFNEDENNPVEKISWVDAVEFCNILSFKEGLEQCYSFSAKEDSIWHCDFDKKGYRLPTEAEWEYACRAGTKTDYYTGSTEKELAKAGWYDDKKTVSSQPVGQKVPNKFGLYDMLGNVAEWCWDWYSIYKTGIVNDPTGPDSGTDRVFRGGSWDLESVHSHSASRSYGGPNIEDSGIGFRVVRTK